MTNLNEHLVNVLRLLQLRDSQLLILPLGPVLDDFDPELESYFYKGNHLSHDHHHCDQLCFGGHLAVQVLVKLLHDLLEAEQVVLHIVLNNDQQ